MNESLLLVALMIAVAGLSVILSRINSTVDSTKQAVHHIAELVNSERDRMLMKIDEAHEELRTAVLMIDTLRKELIEEKKK